MIKILKNTYIDEKDILYIDHYDGITYIHTTAQIFQTYISVKKLIVTLPADFIKINKALVVNKCFIRRIEGCKYVLKNDEILWGAVRMAGFHRKVSKELSGIKFIKK